MDKLLVATLLKRWGISPGSVTPDILDALVNALAVSNVLEKKVSLTALQIQNGFSFPIELLPAPGVGKAIEIMNQVVKFNFGSVSFTSTDMNCSIKTAAKPQMDYTGMNRGDNDFVSLTKNQGTDNMVENQSYIAQMDSDSLVGDSTIDIYLAYRIVTLA